MRIRGGIAATLALLALAWGGTARAEEDEKGGPGFGPWRRWLRWLDRREDVRDRREDRRDRWEDVLDRREDRRDTREDVFDRREDVRDRREDIRDEREDIRDAADDEARRERMESLRAELAAAVEAGDEARAEVLRGRIERLGRVIRRDRREDVLDRREDRRDAREDVRDRREDVFDRREDRRDAREDVRDRRENVRERHRERHHRRVVRRRRAGAPHAPSGLQASRFLITSTASWTLMRSCFMVSRSRMVTVPSSLV